MMASRVAGIVGLAIERAAALADFQRALNAMPTPAVQKSAIVEAARVGQLEQADADLLIQVYQLETV